MDDSFGGGGYVQVDALSIGRLERDVQWTPPQEKY